VTDAQKRQYVYNLYDGPRWKRRVEKMSDDQVIAIYLKHINDGDMPDHHETEEMELPPPQQPPLNGLNTGRGPHANEDQFEIY
jgi:hypothetical protein